VAHKPSQHSEKHVFFKKPNPLVFGGFIRFWGLLGVSNFLCEKLGNLLVDLADQLGFYIDSPVL